MNLWDAHGGGASGAVSTATAGRDGNEHGCSPQREPNGVDRTPVEPRTRRRAVALPVITRLAAGPLKIRRR
jgi:hypothetical protein